MRTYHKNPRTISTKQFTDLEKWLDELGDLSGIVHNLETDEIIGGNQRARVFGLMKNEAAVIEMTRTLPEPDRQGTVGEGYIHWRDGRYGYRQVRWDAETAELANLVANHAGGTWDWDILANEWDEEMLALAGFEEWELHGASESTDNETQSTEELAENYNRKIEAPIYEPKGEKPEIASLYDDTKTRALIAEIDAAIGIDDKEKEFLRIAAQRHTVLRFDRIADYYTHSSVKTQALMENNALIIIDFEKAIELGFVRLTERIANLVREEYGEDE